MRWFFLNNGGPCYVVSVGTYETAADGTSPVEGKKINGKLLQDALKELEKELEPTMIVVPEAVLLNKQGCDAVQQQMLAHCGDTMKNRVAILDVWEGYLPRNEPPFNNLIELARTGFGSSFLAYGAAYYPWVHTSVLQERDLSFLNIHPDSRATLLKCITDELNQMEMPKDKRNAQITEVNKITTATAGEAGPLAASLVTISPFYNTVLREMAKRLNLLPPSAAMAGVYTMVDNTRGVWKAPANVSLNSAVAPAVPISHEQQEDLNVTPQGRSINAIRSFIGEGTLVWGARTLDGNSLDWRYVNVRRTMIMLEESVRLAAKALVFEPNVASTWVTMKGMIANFLTGIWKRGGLAGAVPEDAFSVHVGLGETMTPEDILEGILRVTVLVAISRPAEFIEITFQQQMQKS
ncbi:MAG: phage tail sheath family protein [Betaproteobacteria bacterium]|nr:phage tail sheath family protein [Betaproteobacteria bacterium]